jgi:hypothetical protein
MGISAVASAQETGAQAPNVTVSNIGVRLGVAIPIDGTLRKVSNEFIGAGLEYTFDKQYFANSYTYLAADWLGRTGNGGHGNLFPVTINQRIYTTAARQKVFYYTIGLGAFFVDTAGASDTTLGARGGIGYNFGPYLFGEVTGFVSTAATAGLRPSGVGFYLGYRF